MSRLENLQYRAAKIVTGALHFTSKDKLNSELEKTKLELEKSKKEYEEIKKLKIAENTSKARKYFCHVERRCGDVS